MFNIINSAVAQEAGAAAQAQSPLMSMVPLVLVFLVFYFLMLRPQKKKLEQEQEYLKALKVGDEVYTKAGILGKVQAVAPKVVTIEVENGGRLKILKSHIGGSAKEILENKAEKQEKK